jgi:hypothetical protein
VDLQVERTLLSDLVVLERLAVILKLFTCENETLLISWENRVFLVMDNSLNGVNRVGGFDFQRDGFPGGICGNLHEDLHTADNLLLCVTAKWPLRWALNAESLKV